MRKLLTGLAGAELHFGLEMIGLVGCSSVGRFGMLHLPIALLVTTLVGVKTPAWTPQGDRRVVTGQRRELTMQEVVSGLAGVIVADHEGEGGPDRVENRLDVPADVDQQEAPGNPAAEPLSGKPLCTFTW